MGRQKSGIHALAAALLTAGLQQAFAGEPPVGGAPPASVLTASDAGTGRAQSFDVAANCDVVICSYVNKIVMCHRLPRACAYRPLPRPFHPQRHKSHGSNSPPS
jgi:hypothetical protein